MAAAFLFFRLMAKTVRKNFPVQGMGCAACVARVQGAIGSVKGVEKCSVSLASKSAQVDYDPCAVTPADIKKAVQDAGYDLVVVNGDDEGDKSDEEADRLREDYYVSLRRDAVSAAILALLIMLLGMGFGDFPGKGYVLWALATPAVFWCGRRFIMTAWKQLRHRSASMDTLVALSILISYSFSLFNLLFPSVWTSRGLQPHLYFESASMIGAFILLGRVLQEKAELGTTASVRALAGLQPKSAAVSVGEVFTVRPGDRIPADGEVTEGESYVDESMLTGEPVAVLKKAGDKVYAGTINQKGSFDARAEKVGKDTMLSAIIRMVRDAQGSKAKIQDTVDRVAAVFVPVIIGISLLTLVCWVLFSPSDGLTRGLLAMVSVLVIACPCSLGLATPTALIAGIGNGAKKGILIKDADSLQIAGKVDVMVLDKTGTITEGRPEVLKSRWFTESAEELSEARGVLLAMEMKSEHPLAMAIVAAVHAAAMDAEPAEISGFASETGRGLEASCGGVRYFVGNSSPEPFAEAAEWETDGMTVVWFSSEDRLLAAFGIADRIKDGAADAVARLKKLGVETYMLTGDNAVSAGIVAGKVGISHVMAGMLPQDKAEFISGLQKEGHRVAMTGDGINDSAALARADLSMAMGKGSDMAINAAMVTVVSGDLKKLPQMVELSRRTVRIIRQNLFWAFFYNVLAVPVAAGVLYPVCGFLLNPMLAAACMAMSSVCVVANSLRLAAPSIPSVK